MSTVMVVPSLKVSGGIREALRLAAELDSEGAKASILSMWRSPHAMPSTLDVAHLSDWTPRAVRAPMDLLLVASRFRRWWRDHAGPDTVAVFTHYATLPMALMVPAHQRLFFVQDLEWRFIANAMLSRALRRFVLGVYRTGRIISANAYLTRRLQQEGVTVSTEAPIWADKSFFAPDAPTRDIDFAMVLRKGDHKRLDLYLQFISLARARGMTIAVITPEDEIATQVSDQATELLVRPSQEDMRNLYSRSACFVHLSDHEGFGLPPLEAMGAGCLPVCRDSGGVRAFMLDGPCADLLLPLSLPIATLLDRAQGVVNDPDHAARRSAARQHFLRGLDECQRSRASLLATVLSKENSR